MLSSYIDVPAFHLSIIRTMDFKYSNPLSEVTKTIVYCQQAVQNDSAAATAAIVEEAIGTGTIISISSVVVVVVGEIYGTTSSSSNPTCF